MEKKNHYLSKIRVEMENVRELYVKGYINKEIYKKETKNLYNLAQSFGA